MKFFVGVIGRQYGKTTLALIRTVRRAIETPGVYYWIEPTITQAKAVFEQRFLPFYHPLLREKNVSDRRGTFLNGSRLFFKAQYGWGKPVQPVGGEEGGPIQIEVKFPEL